MSTSFFEVLKNEKPLSVAGAINPYSALLAKKTGIKALYISGAGVANASFGLPDLALTSLDNVLEDLRRIRGISNLPILVDCDTGWGSALNISKTTKEMSFLPAHLEFILKTKYQKKDVGIDLTKKLFQLRKCATG